MRAERSASRCFLLRLCVTTTITMDYQVLLALTNLQTYYATYVNEQPDKQLTPKIPFRYATEENQ